MALHCQVVFVSQYSHLFVRFLVNASAVHASQFLSNTKIRSSPACFQKKQSTKPAEMYVLKGFVQDNGNKDGRLGNKSYNKYDLLRS